MIAIVMAGGKGSRMPSGTEKLLLKYRKPIILHVIDALNESKCFDKILATTSPNAPATKELLEKENIKIFPTKGYGYVEDLNQVLQSIQEDVFVTSGDLPFLDGKIINEIMSRYDKNKIWTSFVITKGFLESLKLSAEFPIQVNQHDCYYSGISLINAKKIYSLKPIKENYEIFDDKRIAFNLNTQHDFDLIGVT